GPANFHTLMHRLRYAASNAPLELFLDLVRLSDWDPQVFLGFKNQLPAQLQYVSKAAYLEMRATLIKVWENFHPIDGDLPFELARLYLSMNEPVTALRFSALSTELFGEHPRTAFNHGLCHFKAGNFAEALQAFGLSLQLQPDYAPAQIWQAHALAQTAIPAD